MPLRTKKWTRSKANMYISRSKACKKLQCSLPSFRKLCILKGIYPHDPKKKHKKEGDRRVYYHRKDIKLLHREPILWQWRNQRTFRNKITKHKGRHNWDKVKRMTLNMPQISMDHLVRERYPSFNDALRDFDDCVTFISLFATLPSGIIPQLTAIRRLECQKLCKEYRNYIISNGLLTKGFISVKGIYYQCRFKNKYDITWIVPHEFAHSIPDDVDYRVMSSFLDFYQTMFRFVIFKLYKESNMKYPPFGHIDYDFTNLSLTTLISGKFTKKRKINVYKKKKRKKSRDFKRIKMDKKNNEIVELDLTEIITDSNELNITENNNNNINNSKYSRKKWDRSNLFEDFKFLLNRETPQFELEFVILSMGGTVIFQQDCDTLEMEKDVSITHQIIDRKLAFDMISHTREYIQPQWIFDCLNTGAVIPSQHYQMAIQCPPHLSPFELYNDQSHIPSQHFVLQHWQKISKQFGGFVPGKKLRHKKEKINHDAVSENENVSENEIEMNLDIGDIMDMDDMDENVSENVSENISKNVSENVSENDVEVGDDDLDGFVESESDVYEEDNNWVWSDGEGEDEERLIEIEARRRMENKGIILEKERIKIANKERGKVMKDLRMEHGLEKDGIPKNKEEKIKVELAKSMMSKKYRKIYEKISRNKSRKSRHLKYLDEKRKKYEQKQMHSRH